MKQRKRRIEPLAFFNTEAIAAHLEKMAQKGWMIDNINNFGWGYRRMEPKKIHFAVSYFPKASEFDPEPTEEQKRFIEFCEHTGWQLACTSAQMQIFYNDGEDPTPIETEPVLEVEAIHAAAKKSFIPSNVCLFVLGLLQAAMWISNLLGDPIDLLSNATNLEVGVCWVLLLFMSGIELTSYLIWQKKARKAAEQGVFLSPPNTMKLEKGIIIGVTLILLCWLCDGIVFGDRLQRWIAIAMCVYLPGLFAITNAVKVFLKKRKASRGLNRALTLLVCFVCAFGITGLITAGTLYASSRGFFDTDKIGTYEYKGTTFSIRDDELPLTVEDLRDVDVTQYTKERSGSQSFLLFRYKMKQRPRYDVKDYDGIPQLDYTVVGVKASALYDLCRDRMLYEAEKRNRRGGVDGVYEYRQEEAAAWQANEVYRLHNSQYGFDDKYLVCYDDMLIEFSFDWEPTEAQKAVIGEKFGTAANGNIS